MSQSNAEDITMANATRAKKFLLWDEAKRRHHLTDVQVQMARELGMNPKKLGKLDNHRQELWKAPLPEFIERLYCKRFKRSAPLTAPSLPRPETPSNEGKLSE